MAIFSNMKWPTRLLTMPVNTFFKTLLPPSLFHSCWAKVNANSVSIDSKGSTTMVKLCLEFIGKECLISIIKDFRTDTHVNKVVHFYEHSNSSLVGPRKTPVRNKMLADVVEYVESEKLCKPNELRFHQIKCYLKQTHL